MKIEELIHSHDVAGFKCGQKDLDRYLKKHALPNGISGYGTSFVAEEGGLVLGYYTLCNSHVATSEVPEEELAEMPRYPVPSVLLAKLAVDRSVQGRGLGRILLFDAMAKFLAIQSLSGARFLEVHALTDQARDFYIRHGFESLLDDPLHMYITLQRVRLVLSS